MNPTTLSSAKVSSCLGALIVKAISRTLNTALSCSASADSELKLYKKAWAWAWALEGVATAHLEVVLNYLEIVGGCLIWCLISVSGVLV